MDILKQTLGGSFRVFQDMDPFPANKNINVNSELISVL